MNKKKKKKKMGSSHQHNLFVNVKRWRCRCPWLSDKAEVFMQRTTMKTYKVWTEGGIQKSFWLGTETGLQVKLTLHFVDMARWKLNFRLHFCTDWLKWLCPGMRWGWQTVMINHHGPVSLLPLACSCHRSLL